MKWTRMVCAAALIGTLLGCASTEHSESAEEHEKLHAQAKIDRVEGERIALQRVPGGTVQEAELEKERGRLIWSFHITTPGSTGITEVELDAMTGKIISVEKEKKAEKEDDKK